MNHTPLDEAEAFEQADHIIAQIDREMRDLVFATEEEERGYFFSRFRELLTTV